jgi:hypothetical protein
VFDFGFGGFGLFRFLFRLFRVLVHAIPARCLPNMSENFTVRKCSRVFILQEDTFGIVLAQ